MEAIERTFAGNPCRFQLPPANPVRLYRGVEGEGLTLAELAKRAAANSLGAGQVEHILSHALSRGHPLTLMRMREVVREEMKGKPLAVFLPLAIDILQMAVVGEDEE